MKRRGMFALLLALWIVGGTASIAVATPRSSSPGPNISPPPECFVIKNGALPTCEQGPDNTWTVLYPTTHGNLDTGGGGSHTRRDIGLVVVIVAVAGIGIIVWRQWGTRRRS